MRASPLMCSASLLAASIHCTRGSAAERSPTAAAVARPCRRCSSRVRPPSPGSRPSRQGQGEHRGCNRGRPGWARRRGLRRGASAPGTRKGDMRRGAARQRSCRCLARPARTRSGPRPHARYRPGPAESSPRCRASGQRGAARSPRPGCGWCLHLRRLTAADRPRMPGRAFIGPALPAAAKSSSSYAVSSPPENPNRRRSDSPIGAAGLAR